MQNQNRPSLSCQRPAAMDVFFLASGEPLATLDAVKFEAHGWRRFWSNRWRQELGISSFLDLILVFWYFVDQSTIGKLGRYHWDLLTILRSSVRISPIPKHRPQELFQESFPMVRFSSKIPKKGSMGRFPSYVRNHFQGKVSMPKFRSKVCKHDPQNA